MAGGIQGSAVWGALSAVAVGAATIISGMPAWADGMAMKVPQASVATDKGYYFWIDGTADKMRLPAYQLGLHNVNTTTGGDEGPIQRFEPKLDGAGVRGAIGYVMPATSIKLEFGGSYTAAKQNLQFATKSYDFAGARFLNGGGAVGLAFDCSFPPIGPHCTTTGSLKTDYTAWQFNGGVSNDWKYGFVTVTPHLAVFGGNTRVGQTLSQFFSQTFFGNSGTYSATTTETWRDIGARVGADVSAHVTAALTVGVGGWVGGANRHTSLSGSDVGTDNTGNAVFGGSSALSIDDSKNVFIANAELGFAYRPLQKVTLRGFVGLNYDSSVPGIASPTFAGSVFAPTGTTAASIYYAAETSYYAGGGLLVKWQDY